MISANITAFLYLVTGILFIMALRGLSSPETSRGGNILGNYWNDPCYSCNFTIV